MTDTLPGFYPPLYLRNPHLQTFLASFRLRALGANPMLSASETQILDTGNGVRLLGALALQRRRPSKGLVIMIHGWEGSIDSTYMLTTGRRLFRNGFDLFRLNLRDHGASHHLNEGIFFATRFQEVFRAVHLLARRRMPEPVFLLGFSLGGNFALRIARHCAVEPIANLRHVASLSPVLDPDKATDCIEADPWILRYFLKKWKRSLRRKQALFPHRYDFAEILKLRSLRRMTELLVPRHTEFETAADYFRGYGLDSLSLTRVPVPTTVITAADDPVIWVSDFRRLHLNANIRLVIQPYGGHLGFIENMAMSCWYERALMILFDGGWG